MIAAFFMMTAATQAADINDAQIALAMAERLHELVAG
jgi:hypothetical protein